MKAGSIVRYGIASVGLAAIGLGCDIRSAQEFRAVAGPALEQAANALADGLLDGAFAVFEPDDSGSDGGNSNANSGG